MKTVILTGAGISAESGLGTFRDAGGLWSEYDLEDVATPEGFARDPGLVHRFYNARRANCLGAAPNAAHRALARLQDFAMGEVVIVTQNIDDLHERGGAHGVIHMHGELLRALCAACGARWDAPPVMGPDDPCPGCGQAATRPDVVWFGEMPYFMDEIEAHLATCDLFASIGTSGAVWPAAGFVAAARRMGARTVELNLEPSEGSGLFHETRLGPATKLVPAWVDAVLGQPPVP
jgi:NAD-dependent deacetylase